MILFLLSLPALTQRNAAARAEHPLIAAIKIDDQFPLPRLRRGRAVSRRCFATDGKRLVMPAFGAYAGGLNVRDRAIVSLFDALSFTAHMLSERRIYAVAAARCLAD